MNLLKRIFNFKKFSQLETIEEKSFWIVAPIVTLIGAIALTTFGSYDSPLPTVFSCIFCFFFPIFLMFVVSKKKNYHTAYPLLCISTGAIAIPITFVFTGGFLSSMPLFCVVVTGITVLCYSPTYRFISLGACLIGNTLAFVHVYFQGSPFPISGSETLYSMPGSIQPVYDDMIFGYYLASIALFSSLNFVINDIRRYKINQDTLQRFFDKEKRNEILRKTANEDGVIGAETKRAVILFADISNFTSISENMPSEVVSKFLNVFFTTADKHIHSTGGIIDKYIGDCVMAYWFDDGKSNCVLNAVDAMLNMKRDTLSDAESIYNQFGTELIFSVGIAYGDVIFGDIGTDNMHDFTVIGDAVNTASRIESYATGGEILISDSAAKMIKDEISLERIESDHFFKGKNKPIDLYRVIGHSASKSEVLFTEREICGYTVHVCGCRGSFPVSGIRFSEYGGETSCYVVKKDDYAVVIDCGTGLKNALKILNGCKNIDILLTHVHYDHILGLLMSKFPLDAKIRVFGHFSAWTTESNTLKEFMEHPYWPVEIIHTETNNVELGREYVLNDEVKTTFYPSDHPDDACVINLSCMGKKITFLFDCENAESLPSEISQNSDLLFFDGMFDDNDIANHKGWGHGTWQEGVRFFEGRNIKKLVITHHNPELGDHSLMEKELIARERCSNVSFAKTGDIFEI